jgi:hypothetical protein
MVLQGPSIQNYLKLIRLCKWGEACDHWYRFLLGSWKQCWILQKLRHFHLSIYQYHRLFEENCDASNHGIQADWRIQERQAAWPN